MKENLSNWIFHVWSFSCSPHDQRKLRCILKCSIRSQLLVNIKLKLNLITLKRVACLKRNSKITIFHFSIVYAC